MFLDINASIIAMMIVAFFIHAATAFWDVSYATTARTVAPVEQPVHSFLEMIPLVAIVCVVSIHWDQFLAIFLLGAAPARFDLTWKREPSPTGYIGSIMAAILLFELLPYVEEALQGLRANAGRFVPEKARRARPGRTTEAKLGRAARSAGLHVATVFRRGCGTEACGRALRQSTSVMRRTRHGTVYRRHQDNE
jgi:hypothetical protein